MTTIAEETHHSATEFRSETLQKAPVLEDDHGGFISTSMLERYEEWLDSKFRFPGTDFRFGTDGLIGLIPGVGDLATTGISMVFLADAWKSGARKRTLLKMASNIGIDFFAGAIPVVGDLLDFAFKSNTKNLRLLKQEREHLRINKLR